MKRLVAIVALVSLSSGGCVDVTPSEERGRLVLLAPPAAQPAIDALLAGYASLGTTLPPAAFYVEASEMLRHLDDDNRVAVVATLDDGVVESLRARVQLADAAVVATAGLVVVGNVAAGNMTALAELGVPVAVQNRTGGAIGGRAYDVLLRYGVLSRMTASLQPTGGVEESLALLQAGSVAAAIVLAPEAIAKDSPLMFAFDPGVNEPLDLRLLLLHERHADARPLFEHLRSAAARATFVARGWSAPR